jgi:uncharacterized protein (DUF433 family)
MGALSQAGETIDDFLEGFPTVGRDKVLAFLGAAGRNASLFCQPGLEDPARS